MTMSGEDRLLQRYLDGELPAAEASDFARRLMSEPGLRERLREAEGLRAGFVAGRGAVVAAPADFTSRLLAQVRRLPSRHELQQADLAGAAVRLCRRLLFVAAACAAIGLAWHAGLFDRGGRETLQAAPDEIQRELQRLDAILLGGGHAEPRRGK